MFPKRITLLGTVIGVGFLIALLFLTTSASQSRYDICGLPQAEAQDNPCQQTEETIIALETQLHQANSSIEGYQTTLAVLENVITVEPTQEPARLPFYEFFEDNHHGWLLTDKVVLQNQELVVESFIDQPNSVIVPIQPLQDTFCVEFDVRVGLLPLGPTYDESGFFIAIRNPLEAYWYTINFAPDQVTLNRATNDSTPVTLLSLPIFLQSDRKIHVLLSYHDHYLTITTLSRPSSIRIENLNGQVVLGSIYTTTYFDNLRVRASDDC